MNASAAATSRKTLVIKRAAILALAVMASTAALHPSPTMAAVSVGDGVANENVNCNSLTHTITVTTQSNGIMTGDVGGGETYSYWETYRVWLKVQEYVDGAWYSVIGWREVTDGTHSIQFTERAGATSYWYFTWAFETPSVGTVYQGEWAGGNWPNPNGEYSDQRGYTTLLSCRS